MASIMDYLDWRGDIPFSLRPFNEADNLILCEASYVHFENIAPGMDSTDTISISEAAGRYLELHQNALERAADGSTRKSPLLLYKMAQTPRYANVQIGGYVNSFSKEREEQMCAVTFFLPDGTAYAAFRGTDNTLAGWKEDFNLSFLSETPGQKHAADYLSLYLKDTQCPLRIGGHSKGGNFAVYASAFCAPQVCDRILEVYNNDGPGFLSDVVASQQYQAILPKVCSIIPEGSVFGLLLHHGYDHHIVKSSGKGIYQHDLMTWEVLGTSLREAASLTPVSAFLEKTLQAWVEKIDYEDRQAFVETLFEILTSGGADTLTDLGRFTLPQLKEHFRSFREMSSEEQKTFITTFTDLFKSGWNTFLTGLTDGRKPDPQEMIEAPEADRVQHTKKTSGTNQTVR